MTDIADLWDRWEITNREFQACPDDGELCRKEDALERQIVSAPAQTIADVLIKLRLADYVVRRSHTDTRNGAIEEDTLENEDRLILSAYADLKRLVDGSAS